MQKSESTSPSKATGSLHVKIVSPEKVLFEGEVERVAVPGISGSFEIYKDHAPIISSLARGKVVCDGDGFRVGVKSGFVEMSENNASICIEVDKEKEDGK